MKNQILMERFTYFYVEVREKTSFNIIFTFLFQIKTKEISCHKIFL